MPFLWRRPANIDFPLVHLNFSALDSDGINSVHFRIEDLQSDRFEDVLAIMKDKHLLDEPMYSSKGVRDEPDSLSEMVENWSNMLHQYISLVCYKEGSEEIIALNILGVIYEQEFDAPKDLKGKGWSEVNKLKKFVKNIFFDPFSHYEVDHVMFAAGLYVHENYRNRGIAVEMLRAREEIGKVAGVRVSSNVFSSLGAQKAALKAGFEENFSIKYKDLPRFTSDGYFPNIKDEHMKIMSKKFF